MSRGAQRSVNSYCAKARPKKSSGSLRGATRGTLWVRVAGIVRSCRNHRSSSRSREEFVSGLRPTLLLARCTGNLAESCQEQRVFASVANAAYPSRLAPAPMFGRIRRFAALNTPFYSTVVAAGRNSKCVARAT
jgi:hypothetical protein